MRPRLLHALALATLLSGFACSDDSTSPSKQHSSTPPTLPPASTMSIDLAFPAADQANASQQDIRTGKPGPETLAASADHLNWINAFVRASFVVLVTADQLEEPAAAFALAIHSVPQPQDDGSFLWPYIFVDRQTGAEYQIFLYGARGDETVVWRLEVSSDNASQPLDHFVWFSGESANEGHSGYWQFYSPVDATSGTEVSRIDWQKVRGDQRLTITVNGSGLENEGDVLDFHHTRAQSTIDFFDASAALTSNITWFADGSGSLTVPDYNGGSKACWDTHQLDVACE